MNKLITSLVFAVMLFFAFGVFFITPNKSPTPGSEKNTASAKTVAPSILNDVPSAPSDALFFVPATTRAEWKPNNPAAEFPNSFYNFHPPSDIRFSPQLTAKPFAARDNPADVLKIINSNRNFVTRE